MAKRNVKGSVFDRLIEAMRNKGEIKSTGTRGLQSEAAKFAKLSQPTVRAWQFGSGPSVKDARDLAMRLDICVEWLYTGMGPKRPGPPSGDRLANELWDLWPRLSDEVKMTIVGHARLSSMSETIVPMTQPKGSLRK